MEVSLDSCVVIDLMKNGLTKKLIAKLRKRSIILCDVVLEEVRRIRGFSANTVIETISRILKTRVQVSSLTAEQDRYAKKITEQYHWCHRGDDRILSNCRANSYILVTSDRKLLDVADWVGVVAFPPSRVGEI